MGRADAQSEARKPKRAVAAAGRGAGCAKQRGRRAGLPGGLRAVRGQGPPRTQLPGTEFSPGRLHGIKNGWVRLLFSPPLAVSAAGTGDRCGAVPGRGLQSRAGRMRLFPRAPRPVRGGAKAARCLPGRRAASRPAGLLARPRCPHSAFLVFSFQRPYGRFWLSCRYGGLSQMSPPSASHLRTGDQV